ncbi:MAG TPA: hypothetical protein VH701_08340 [Vicinamibacterales bacterium]|jgi:hypothetical protein
MVKNANRSAVVESLAAAVWCGGCGWALLVLVPSVRAMSARPGGWNVGDLLALTVAAVWLMLAAYVSWRVLAASDRMVPRHPLVRGAIAGASIPTTAFLVLAPVVAIASVVSTWEGPTGTPFWAASVAAMVSGVRSADRFIDLAIWLPVTVASGVLFAAGRVRWARRTDAAVMG